MGRRRRGPGGRGAKAAAKPSEDSPPDTDPTSSSSLPSGPSTETDPAASHHKSPLSGLQPHQDGSGGGGGGGDEAWNQSDRRALRRRLLDMIHRFYLDAISRLPPAEFRSTTGLARGLFVGGHCFGPLHPVHNIVVNSIWYAAAFPVRRPAGSDDDEDEANALLSSDGIVRICHRSLDGLVAALRGLCPSLSDGDALWRLFSSSADLAAAIALANGVSKSSALRVVASQGHTAFHLAALVAQHPDPTAFAHFASSELPSINGQHNIVQLLIMRPVLASRHISYLSRVLVPSSPNAVAPLMLSAKVLDCIAAQKQQFKGIGKQMVNVVNMALQEYTQRSGEQLKLHSVCGASLLKEEGLENCYHINFLAYHEDSGSAKEAPVLFFTEAVALSCDETDIRLCVPLDLVTDIGCCFACERNRKKIVHPFYHEYLGGHEFQEDEIDYGSNFPSPLDVDYIFFDADRDRAFANYLWKESMDDEVGCEALCHAANLWNLEDKP